MAARILVLDDDETVALTLAAVLEKEGHEATTAGSLEEARGWLGQLSFDVAVIDPNLAGEDGLTFLDELRDRWPETVSLLLTGYPSLQDAIRGFRAGACDYLVKSVEAMSLLASIDRALTRRRQLFEIAELGLAAQDRDLLLAIDAERTRLLELSEERPAAVAELDRLKRAALETATVQIREGLAAVYASAQLLLRQLGSTPPDPAELVPRLENIRFRAGALVNVVEDLQNTVLEPHPRRPSPSAGAGFPPNN